MNVSDPSGFNNGYSVMNVSDPSGFNNGYSVMNASDPSGFNNGYSVMNASDPSGFNNGYSVIDIFESLKSFSSSDVVSSEQGTLRHTAEAKHYSEGLLKQLISILILRLHCLMFV